MRPPLVSIVMPTFNAATYIEESLLSVALQQYSNLELIIVDGGSSDNTLNIVEKYKDDKNDIRIIQTTDGGGLGADLNEGLKAARGDFIARLDADDVAYKERLISQVNFLVQNPDVDLVGSGVDYIGHITGTAISPQTHAEIRDMYLVNNPFFHPTVMFRRRLYDKGIYYYNTTFRGDEDYELWGRVISSATTANLGYSSMAYRLHSGNAQRTPARHRYKLQALRTFIELQGINDSDIAEVLAEFQCSSFISPKTFEIFKEYGKRAEKENLPKLGWIHRRIMRSGSYSKFIEWYWRIKNWRMSS